MSEKKLLRAKQKIRVLIVDASVIAAQLVAKILDSDPDIKIIGMARRGKEAVEMSSSLNPDLIALDIKVLYANGLAAIEQIMAYKPTPILALADLEHRIDESLSFKAFEVGILDIMPKPSLISLAERPQANEELIRNVKLLAKVKVIAHPKGKHCKNTSLIKAGKDGVFKVVAIVSSAGGPRALMQILSKFPSDLPATVLVTQHLTEGFSEKLAKWLDENCKIRIREAKEGDELKSGLALISPTAFHMQIDSGAKIKLNDSPKIGIKPSGDVLLSSVAEVCGDCAIGVVLTGMGSDGAKGIKAIKESGGKTLAQDRESSVVFGMPKVAIENGFIDEIVPLDKMAEKIMKLCKKNE